LQKQQLLQRELQAAKKRYSLLQQQLASLDDTYTEALEDEICSRTIKKTS